MVQGCSPSAKQPYAALWPTRVEAPLLDLHSFFWRQVFKLYLPTILEIGNWFSGFITTGNRKVSVAVIDGITVGHPCCAVHNCHLPLENNQHRFCTVHQGQEAVCTVIGCSELARPSHKTCKHPDHEKVEGVHNDQGQARFQLQECLRRARIAHSNDALGTDIVDASNLVDGEDVVEPWGIWYCTWWMDASCWRPNETPKNPCSIWTSTNSQQTTYCHTLWHNYSAGNFLRCWSSHYCHRKLGSMHEIYYHLLTIVLGDDQAYLQTCRINAWAHFFQQQLLACQGGKEWPSVPECGPHGRCCKHRETDTFC